MREKLKTFFDAGWNETGMFVRRASMTVESAVIVPLTVLVLALLVVLTFYVHNRVWYTCAACETAIHGNMPVADKSHEAEESAETLARQRIDDQVMPGSKPELSLSVNRSSTDVGFSGQTYAMFQQMLTPFHVAIKVDQVRPEKYVRLVWSGGKYHAD